MTGKIFRSTIFVAILVLLCAISIILGVLYNYFDDVQMSQLRDELRLAAVGTEESGLAFLKKIDSDHFRLTWVAADGSVIYDTHADAYTLDNHADRKEIRDAFLTGTGEDFRHSNTLLERTAYEAKQLSDGSVLRISISQKTMMILLVGMLHPMCIVIVIAIALSALLAGRMAKRIVEPLNDLDLERPLSNDTYEELAPLLRRLNQQHRQIQDQMRKLQRKTDEFLQITSNMQEGLVVLDKETNIRSINSAALQIFSAEESCLGKSFFMMNRSSLLRQALNDALDKGHGSAVQELQGRVYRFDMSSIQSDGNLLGAVILVVDVTQSRNAEQLRREFSANVSHELKTPLQGIIGSAELLESGMVKPEDEARFLDYIRKEASRLVNLVEDIIRLSQLDEGVELPVEDVDLLELSKEVVGILETSAEKRRVTLSVSGAGFSVQGVRRLLYEIVYNLCDNAIQYNVPGGSVRITVENRRVTVKDTGIGIPKEHWDRIFERFYRVDKSHSKQSGGTGLGLSIVKHAAAYHNATLDLDSVPGKGTAITVKF